MPSESKKRNSVVRITEDMGEYVMCLVAGPYLADDADNVFVGRRPNREAAEAYAARMGWEVETT